MTPEKTAALLEEILRELARPHGPTESQDVVVHDSWTDGDEVFIVYSAPWYDGRLGYRQHLTGHDETFLVEDIAHFTIAEPLGRLSLMLGPPDDRGVTWWDDATSIKLNHRDGPPNDQRRSDRLSRLVRRWRPAARRSLS